MLYKVDGEDTPAMTIWGTATESLEKLIHSDSMHESVSSPNPY